MVTTTEKIKIVSLKVVPDAKRGNIVIFQAGEEVIMPIQRAWVIWGVPKDTQRGGHAHRNSWQMHHCVNGSVSFIVDDGTGKQEILLDTPDKGLFIHPLVWGEFKFSSPETVMIVYSSDRYDEKDYIRDRDEFNKIVHGQK